MRKIHPYGVLPNGRPKGPMHGELQSQQDSFKAYLKAKLPVVHEAIIDHHIKENVSVPVAVSATTMFKRSKRTRSSIKSRITRSAEYFHQKTANTRLLRKQRVELERPIKLPSSRDFSGYEDRCFKIQQCSECDKPIRKCDSFETTYYGKCYMYTHVNCSAIAYSNGGSILTDGYTSGSDMEYDNEPKCVQSKSRVGQSRPIAKEQSKYKASRKKEWRARKRASGKAIS